MVMKTLAHTFILLMGFLALFAACGDDYGTPCDFPQSPEVLEVCATHVDAMGNMSTATCIDDFNPDCETRVCVSFEGRAAFCSLRCDSNGNCPSDSFCTTSIGATNGVCIPDRFQE